MTRGWYRQNCRVQYRDTDQMGVVHHGNYVAWFEVGRTEWMRHRGLDYHRLEARGLFLPLVDVHVRYLKPARFDECVAIFTRLASFSAVRFVFSYEIRGISEAAYEADARGADVRAPSGTRLAEGSTTHVCVDAGWNAVRLDRVAPDIYALASERCPPDS